jgi:histidinol phosphatase-like enzyme
MDISLTYRRDTHLAAVYFNGGKPNMFRIFVDATLVDLKQQLDEINHCCNDPNDDRTVTSVEYRKPSIGSDGSISFNNKATIRNADPEIRFGRYIPKYIR